MQHYCFKWVCCLKRVYSPALGTSWWACSKGRRTRRKRSSRRTEPCSRASPTTSFRLIIRRIYRTISIEEVNISLYGLEFAILFISSFPIPLVVEFLFYSLHSIYSLHFWLFYNKRYLRKRRERALWYLLTWAILSRMLFTLLFLIKLWPVTTVQRWRKL